MSIVAISILSILALIGFFSGMQAPKKESAQNATPASTKVLTQDDKLNNAKHMVAATNNICDRFDDTFKKYAENMDNITYSRKPLGTIYNNFKYIEDFSRGIQADAADIQILDSKYEEDKQALIQVEVLLQLASHHMMDHLDDPKGVSSGKAEKEISDSFQLNKLVRERVAAQAKEDGLTAPN